jgi:MFS superfamily sulfate permease-like transporter
MKTDIDPSPPSLKTAQPGAVGKDFLASIVVFLVALPLCLGIAIASGAPPALGLITGIVGGLIVGSLAGSPLQVSGPAAGLAVLVADLIGRFGMSGLAVAVLLAGLLQLVAGVLRGGRWFQAVPPSLVYGMLAGIGVLIFAAQFHVMVDDKPRSNGLQNVASIPEAIWKGLYPSGSAVHDLAALTGLITIAVLVAWTKYAPRRVRAVPAALVAVVVGTVVANVWAFPINYVKVPDNLLGAANWVQPSLFKLLLDPALLGAAVGLAVVASAETLLSAAAVDRMHDGPRTDFDRELRAQGIGNIICGLFGALPMTGVIVRSSTNVTAGAKTRLSAILHGAWLLAFVVALPFVLRLIPVASLAAVLVFTGYKLVNVGVVRQLRQYGRGEVVVYAATLAVIVAVDLLTGVLTGLALAVVKLLVTSNQLQVRVEHDQHRDHVAVELSGTASFLRLPQLVRSLRAVPASRAIEIRIRDLSYIDHASVEALADWERLHLARGAEVSIPWEQIKGHARMGTASSSARTTSADGSGASSAATPGPDLVPSMRGSAEHAAVVAQSSTVELTDATALDDARRLSLKPGTTFSSNPN